MSSLQTDLYSSAPLLRITVGLTLKNYMKPACLMSAGVQYQVSGVHSNTCLNVILLSKMF